MEHKNTWQEIAFTDLFPNRQRNLVVGMSFPRNDGNLGLEPSILSVLPYGENVIYCEDNRDFNDDDVEYYLCSVYIAGVEEFKEWAQRHDKNKIIVGGYHPTSFPNDFKNDAYKIVQGPCDDIYETINQPGQVVSGVSTYNRLPRYDLYDITKNQQIIPDKKPDDICTSINTSIGCPYKCDFCCSPVMCPKLVSKPLELVKAEARVLRGYQPKWIFIRDENFPLQKDWKERLKAIYLTGARIYMFASANLLQNEEDVKFMACHGVYMICLGLEDVTQCYGKNKKLAEAIKLLKKYNIYTYLSFIVNPLAVIGREEGNHYYSKLMEAFYDLKPEMVCGNFLMPFPGTKMWDKYYAYVSKEDYKYYDSKTPFLARNEVLREKMKFFMFWYQYQYFTSATYNNEVREFAVGDTLHLRFKELNEYFKSVYYRNWNLRC